MRKKVFSNAFTNASFANNLYRLPGKPKANAEAKKGMASVRNDGEQAHSVSYKDLCAQAKDMLMRKPISNQFGESDEIKDLMNWNKLMEEKAQKNSVQNKSIHDA